MQGQFILWIRAGNIVELIARFDLHDEVNEPFSSAHIRNISETGIVFNAEAFDTSVNEMMQQYQLEYFQNSSHCSISEQLVMTKDYLSLCLEQRNWYPTNIPAKIFPLSIVFENNKNEYRLQL